MNFLFLFVLHDKNGSFLPNRRVILRSQRMRSAWQHPILCFGFWRPSNWLLGDWSVFINLMFPPCRRSYCQTFLGWSLHGRRLLSRSPRREKYQTKFLELFIFIMSIQISKYQTPDWLTWREFLAKVQISEPWKLWSTSEFLMCATISKCCTSGTQNTLKNLWSCL